MEPAMVRRIQDLIVDPGGWIWIFPTLIGRLGDGFPVLLANPQTGEVRATKVLAFPVAFGEPGVYYGTALGERGLPALYRFTAR